MLLADDYSSSVWGGATFCSAESLIGTVQFPLRESSDVIERRSVLAILNSLRVRVRYTGQQDGKKDWHWIRPHALGYSGVSWFLRSWCETYDQFQDFSLNRMLEIEWSKQHAPIPEPDTEWEEWTTLRLRANRGLSRPERQAVELDYGMTTGVLKIRVRKAMLGYQLDRLGLASAERTPLLEIPR
jgi:predicted DNA-binding transcriptional regulator YafY